MGFLVKFNMDLCRTYPVIYIYLIPDTQPDFFFIPKPPLLHTCEDVIDTQLSVLKKEDDLINIIAGALVPALYQSRLKF